MEISSKSGSPASVKTGCIVAGVYQGGKPSPAAQALDKASRRALARILKRGDLEGKIGQTLLLHHVDGIAAERVLLFGLGEKDKLDAVALRKAVAAAAAVVGATGAGDAVFAVTDLKNKVLDEYWLVRHAVEAANWALYRFDATKSEKPKPRKLKRIAVLEPVAAPPARRDRPDLAQALKHANAVSNGIALARELANLPGNVCTPTYLAAQARALAKSSPKLTCKVLEEADMKKLGMGALLSVSRGSREPAKLIALEWKGGRKGDKPHALVGKGLTFDAGGISLKPGLGMDEMKFDMCGAAGVLGAMKAIAELKLPLNVVGVIPSSENLPDGAANKPGDIVTTMAGLTVEILNTDAEGRLILCDALTWTERTYQPSTVIDIATLTGACVIALGSHATGLLSNDDRMAEQLYRFGQLTGDRAWRLPLWEDYQEQLKSNFADVANIGGREAGTITAASFLARFTRKMRWAHLDVAGTAWRGGPEKGATGRPVALLVQYLLGQA